MIGVTKGNTRSVDYGSYSEGSKGKAREGGVQEISPNINGVCNREPLTQLASSQLLSP